MGQDQLTDIRHLIWSAIEGYAPLDGVFIAKFKDDGEAPYFDGDNQNPELTSLPAIGVWPADADSSAWFENTNQLLKIRFDIKMWTPGWELASSNSKPERWVWLVREALWRAGANGSTDPNQSFIKLGTCYYPEGFRATYRKIRTGNRRSQMLTQTTMSVTLSIKDDPRTTA